MYKFTAASECEPNVFGSSRPGYSNKQVAKWIEFMQYQNIKYVCCLLASSQLTRYSNLLDTYRQNFGFDHVCWTPIEDFHIATPEILIHQILPFLATARQDEEKVVIHCSGGVGRTGHVLAAWLVAGRGLSSQAALAAVKQIGKNPYEAVIAAPFIGRNPWKVAAELNLLLNECSRVKKS